MSLRGHLPLSVFDYWLPAWGSWLIKITTSILWTIRGTRWEEMNYSLLILQILLLLLFCCRVPPTANLKKNKNKNPTNKRHHVVWGCHQILHHFKTVTNHIITKHYQVKLIGLGFSQIWTKTDPHVEREDAGQDIDLQFDTWVWFPYLMTCRMWYLTKHIVSEHFTSSISLNNWSVSVL